MQLSPRTHERMYGLGAASTRSGSTRAFVAENATCRKRGAEPVPLPPSPLAMSTNGILRPRACDRTTARIARNLRRLQRQYAQGPGEPLRSRTMDLVAILMATILSGRLRFDTTRARLHLDGLRFEEPVHLMLICLESLIVDWLGGPDRGQCRVGRTLTFH